MIAVQLNTFCMITVTAMAIVVKRGTSDSGGAQRIERCANYQSWCYSSVQI